MALWAEYERLVRAGFLTRAGRLYAFGIATSFAVVAGYRAARGDAAGAHAAFGAGLPLISLAAGLVAWAAARDLTGEEEAVGLPALASLAGLGTAERAASRTVATMTVVARAVGVPALLLALVSLLWPTAGEEGAPAVARLGSAVAASFGVLGYAVLFGIALGGLSRWASALAPSHGRAMFAALVLAPLLFHDVAGTPDPFSAFGWVIARVAAMGPDG